MRLATEFIRVPLQFDAPRLAAEIAQFDESEWRPHPEGHRGNSALPLVAVGGDTSNDEVRGPMWPTPHLARCPYLREVLTAFRAPIGRTRLMRIDGNAEATRHFDTSYYWQQRVRVHVPIVTDPAVRFICGSAEMHMAAGETWLFDTWKLHNVINPNPSRRIHLVADTVGSPAFWAIVRGEVTANPPPALQFEERNFPVVMSPDEQGTLWQLLELDLPGADGTIALRGLVGRFFDEWRDVWHKHGEARSGWPRYGDILTKLDAALAPYDSLPLRNGMRAAEIVRQFLIRPALNPDLEQRPAAPTAHVALRRIERPVFIVSSPRAGSSLLFETMVGAPRVFSPGGESHSIIEGIAALHPASHEWSSNRLTADDASPAIASMLESRFLESLRDRSGNRVLPDRVRVLEKTPKNSLRLPFLKAVFPDARFIYLHRDPRATISSMLEAWRSGRFVTYPDLPSWEGPPWSLLLVPGWRELSGRPLAEIVAAQWSAATRVLLDDLEMLPAADWCVSSYDALVGDPQKEIERLCEFVGFEWDRTLTAPLPLSRHTLTPPRAEKWKRNGEEIDAIFDSVRETADRARDVFARTPTQRVRVAPERPAGALAFASIHTSSFPEILTALRSSLLVSTYQSGRVVVVRASEGTLNTHLVTFPSPMGMAVGPRSLAIGTARHVWDYRNVTALAARLEPAGKHDACFMPRNIHVTGDIRIHEVAFDADDELWMVNTRFSTLCTLDRDHSFVPRWRPKFITQLGPEDRCHLNGLAMLNGRPRFVTALGRSDVAGGWRESKADGGILMDVDSGEIVASGLSMPHSPRWYAGRMWLLESGKGTLSTIDLASGRFESVAQLPGFTRGLAFAGPYAFIGLSQVRESVFEGIPLAQRLGVNDRACGVWVVDIRSGGIVAFLKFEGSVQEIFDVQLLHGLIYPELLDADAEALTSTWALPDEALKEVRAE